MATGPSKKGYRRLIAARQPHFSAYKLIERERASLILRSNSAPGGANWDLTLVLSNFNAVVNVTQWNDPSYRTETKICLRTRSFVGSNPIGLYSDG
jgi:hypothetical protein